MKRNITKTKVKVITNEDLSVAMLAGFKEVNKRFDGVDKRIDKVDIKIDKLDKKIDSEIESLASMVARGFDSVNKEIVEVKNRLGKVENDIVEVKENLASTRMDVLGIGDKFVSRNDFNQHLIRFSLLEEKVKASK